MGLRFPLPMRWRRNPSEPVTDPKILMVKFARSGDPAKQQEKIRRLVGENSVRNADQLFPDDSDDELATLFEVVLSEGASLDQAKASLDGDDDVEYAHEPVERSGR